MGRPAFTDEHATIIHADHIQNLIAYGFTRSESDRVITDAPNPHFYSNSTVNRKLSNLASQGFTPFEIRQVVLGAKTFLGAAEGSVNNKLHILRDYGFNPAEVKAIVLGRPTVLCISDENLSGKLRNLEAPRFTTHSNAFCLTREEVKKLVLGFPRVLGLDCEPNGNMDKKLRLMALITEGDRHAMLEHAQRFMQGPAKTIARLRQLHSRGIDWKDERSRHLLFSSETTFKRRFC